ncbi:MAG: phosphoglycerate kinase [Holosporaceae bacterium]|jgi:phosphoglycerate kinase|nr:phosphoglycerate kinase [Holosporaceae bacterium]
MHNSKAITRKDLKNKRVLVRVDFNVPMDDGVIQDNSRIKNAFSTIKFLKDAQAKIILISHFGKTTYPNQIQSLKIIADEVSREYNSKIIFVDNCLDKKANTIIKEASTDSIILMENLRFHLEEEKCDMKFAKRLAGLADFYINEAFSTSHRRHASIFAIPQFLPHALGLSFKKEIETIDKFLDDAESPKMCIIGGAKLSTKINLLKNLVKRVDKLALGGGIAGAFLSFLGNSSLKIFNSEEFKEDVKEIIKNSQSYNCELIMPMDFSALVSSGGAFHHAIVSAENDNATIFDIGPNSVELFKRHVRESKMVLWNGPVGLFEKAPFDFGTLSIAKDVARLTRDKKLISIIGGGDTSFAMNKFKISQDLSYVSTAGGAFLSYLEGTELPGIKAMKDPYVLT